VDGGGSDVLGHKAKKRSREVSGTAASAFEHTRAQSGEGKRRRGGGRLSAAWGKDRSREGGAGVWRRVSQRDTGATAGSWAR
jgi:hypothetical protein